MNRMLVLPLNCNERDRLGLALRALFIRRVDFAVGPRLIISSRVRRFGGVTDGLRTAPTKHGSFSDVILLKEAECESRLKSASQRS